MNKICPYYQSDTSRTIVEHPESKLWRKVFLATLIKEPNKSPLTITEAAKVADWAVVEYQERFA